MIEFGNRGSKRRFPNADENERIALRQTILNMSICKLQKDQGRKEPSLFRSVIIANTVRSIENEMDQEVMDNYYNPRDRSYGVEYCIQSNSHPKVHEAQCISSDNSIVCDSVEISEPNKFGVIGDQRKIKAINSHVKEDRDSSIINNETQNLWDNFKMPSVSSFTFFENMDLDNAFPEVDIAHYNFDNGPPPYLLPYQNYSGNIYGNSCAVDFHRTKSDSFFEELDQIMQVLVGI